MGGGIPGGVTTAVTQMMDWSIEMATTVFADPVLSLGIAMWIVGGAIGLFKRLV